MVLGASTADDARVLSAQRRGGAQTPLSHAWNRTYCRGCGTLLIQKSCPACELRREEAFRQALERRRGRLAELLAGHTTVENEHLARRVRRAAERV